MSKIFLFFLVRDTTTISLGPSIQYEVLTALGPPKWHPPSSSHDCLHEVHCVQSREKSQKRGDHPRVSPLIWKRLCKIILDAHWEEEVGGNPQQKCKEHSTNTFFFFHLHLLLLMWLWLERNVFCVYFGAFLIYDNRFIKYIYRFVYTKKKRKIFFINNNGNMMNVFVLYLLTVKKEIKKIENGNEMKNPLLEN